MTQKNCTILSLETMGRIVQIYLICHCIFRYFLTKNRLYILINFIPTSRIISRRDILSYFKPARDESLPLILRSE